MRVDYDINDRYRVEERVHQVLIDAEKNYITQKEMEQRLRKKQEQDLSLVKNGSMKLSATLLERYRNENAAEDSSSKLNKVNKCFLNELNKTFSYIERVCFNIYLFS